MKIGIHSFPRLERRRLRDGRIWFYWPPPPGPARDLFTTQSLGGKLDREALRIYAERETSYAQWLAERAADSAQGNGPIPYGTVDWLLEGYEKSTHWPPSPKSQTDYRNKLLFLRNWRLTDGRRLGSLP